MANKVIKITEFPSSLPNYWNPYHSFQKSASNIDNIFTHIQTMLSPFINSNIIYILGKFLNSFYEFKNLIHYKFAKRIYMFL